MYISAVIPAKGNSSRLPGKNILAIGENNLLVNKIMQLKNSNVDEIIVSSDSDVMIEMAEKEGIRAVKRPSDLADESRPFGDLIEYITDIIDGDCLMWAPVTSPTLDANFYTDARNRFEAALNDGYDSLTTVEVFKHFLIDKDGRPYNFNPDAAITNSQQLPPMYKWTCGCSIIPREFAKKFRFIFGKRPFCYEVTQYQGLDIDTYFDYMVSKLVFEEKNDAGQNL